MNKTNIKARAALSILSLDSIVFSILALVYISEISRKTANPLPHSIVLASIFVYLLVDHLSINKNLHRLKLGAFLTIVSLLIYFPAIFLITQRQDKNNIILKVDSAIISEQAARFLISGINPYGASYETSLVGWNFAMDGILYDQAKYHYPYLPIYTVINSMGTLIISSLLGFFDLRIILLIVLSFVIYLIFRTQKEKSDAYLFSVLILFNPLFLTSFLWGVNDIYIFFLIMLSAILLRNGNERLGLLATLIASGIKHSAWPIIPFVMYFIYLNKKGHLANKLISTLKVVKFPLLLFCLLIIPFVLWNPKAFWTDIWLYPNGGVDTNVAISGYGLSELLINLGLIKNRLDYFPFYIPQVLICLPLIIILFTWQKRKNTVGQLLFNYTVLLFPLWYLSRIFHANYMAYISMLIILTYFVAKNENSKIFPAGKTNPNLR